VTLKQVKQDREKQILEFEKAGRVEIIPNGNRMESTGREYWMNRGLPREFVFKSITKERITYNEDL